MDLISIVKRKKGLKVLIILLIIIQVVLFYSYIYGDILTTTVHGMGVWDLLLKGNIRDFYYTNFYLGVNLFTGDSYPGYDFLIYIVFAIWNFPLWLIKTCFNIDPLSSIIGILWAKSIVLFFYGCVIFVINKIFAYVNIDRFYIFVVLMSTSIYFSGYISIVGQYDIITVLFICLGIYYLLKNNIKMFIVFSAISISIKALALFAIIPIIFYYQKNIIKIILYLCFIILPTCLFRVAIPMNNNNNTNVFFEFLFHNSFNIGSYKTSIFLIIYICFLLYCYIKIRSDKTNILLFDFVFITFISYSIFVTCAFSLPYWMIYIMPFMYMIIMMSDKFNINIILETLMSFFIMIAHSLTFWWVFSSKTLKNALWAIVLSDDSNYNYSITDFIQTYFIDIQNGRVRDFTIQISWAIYISMLIFFIIINNPTSKLTISKQINDRSNLYIILCIRFFLLIIIYLIPFAGLLVK